VYPSHIACLKGESNLCTYVPYIAAGVGVMQHQMLGGNSDLAVDSSRTVVQTGESLSYNVFGQERQQN
jgi:hypothetical protein